MVAGRRADSRLLERVAEVYEWLELQLHRGADLSGTCKRCGDCCNFDAFDHRLFVSPPELLYMASNIGAENVKTMTTGRCPHNVAGSCSVYEHRFAGCRIFTCGGDADFQSEMSEAVLARFKAICTQFDIPYEYVDLPTALNARQFRQ